MTTAPIRIDWTSPGLGQLLSALGASIVHGERRVAVEPSPGQQFEAEIAAVGWATVELERAEAELGAEFGTVFEAAPRDALLGSTVRRSAGREPTILVLEPDTEGCLSGALAKHGEGPVALYLRVPSLEQLPGTLALRTGSGPLGPARLALTGDPWGPFLILVGEAPDGADRVPSGL